MAGSSKGVIPIKKIMLKAVLVAIFFIAAGICYFLFVHSAPTEMLILPTEAPQEAATSDVRTESSDVSVNDIEDVRMLTVFVCGAVISPGLYELQAGARIADCIEAAGGFAPEASRDWLNIALHVEDEQKVYVPTLEEASAGGSVLGTAANGANGVSGEGSTSGLVNINTASKQTLMTLIGVGEKKADNIIAYREANGFFKTTDDLMKVNGIGKSIFEGIRDLICV